MKFRHYWQNWQVKTMARVKLGDVAREYRETCKGSKKGLRAVGLEHLEPENIALTQWETSSDNTFSKLFYEGQMLFGRRRAYLKKAAVAPFDGICSGDITVIEANPEKLLPTLMPFIIQSNAFFDFAIEGSAGSLSPRVKWEHLSQYEFNLPSMEEQEKLAEVLWAFEKTKTSYKTLLAKAEELVQAQFIEMFGDPEINPMQWPKKRFVEFASIDANMTDDYTKYADFPHIGIDSIEKDTGSLVGYRTVSEDNVISGKYHFTPSHIIYSKIRPNLNKVAIPSFEGLCSADAYPILPNIQNCNKLYLAFVMRSIWFLKYIVPFSARSNMPKVNRNQIEGFVWPLPPRNLQDQFANFVQTTESSKFAIQQSLSALDQARNALMEKTFR